MSANVISINGLSKAYNVYAKPLDILREAVFGRVRHDVFWALRDINLEVKEGQRIGLIGPNGAGKSTLLKIISGNLAPTAGTVEVNGRISAMLSLTSFLDPERTGLENIRFNLLVNGTQASDIPALTEEIIDFTELGAFIRAPVRTYSSGMNARLAFAITTAVTPDILVIDEVLAAGDAYFAAKATMRVIELCERGRALLFVSHAMNAVQLLCDTAVWMDNGSIRDIGPVEEIARRYEADFRRQEDEHVREGNAMRAARQTNTVLPEELGHPDLIRLRLTGPGGRVHDTHYVRALKLRLGATIVEVPLEFADIGDEGVVACLDIASSEWGRLHDRQGYLSRTLAPGSSHLRGGHILVRLPLGGAPLEPFELTVESTSLGASETLKAQVADGRLGEWRDLDIVSTTAAGSGWHSAMFEGALRPLDPGEHAQRIEEIRHETRPEVEIVGVRMLVEGQEALAVRERQPFSIEILVEADRVVPVADVWIKFTRDDGFYVFWQSSGQVGCNLENFQGARLVVFHFDPNIFGAGDYEVEVDVANGFDVERNWPHREVFDRRIDALKFTVAREWKLLMFGPVNHRFNVEIREPSEGDEGAGHERPISVARRD